MTVVTGYSETRQVDADLFDSLPGHWDVMRLSRAARLLTEKAAEADFKIGLEHVEGWSGRYVPTENDEFEGEGVAFREGDVLFGKLRPYLAKAWLADRDGAAVGDFHVYRPHRLEGRYLQYLLLTAPHIELVNGSTYGSKMPRASWDFIGSVHQPVPPRDEQRQIAEYLDRETGQIDALIAKQEQLVETLTERRQAVIARAVTRGLDPDVEVTHSKLKWLTVVPEHWSEMPFIRVATERVDYRGATPTKTDEGILLITAKNVQSGFIDYKVSREYVAEHDYEVVMRRGKPAIGDILLTMEAPLGNVALVDRVDVALAQRVVKFRLQADLAHPEFVGYAMNSAYFQHELLSRATGSTALGIKASKLAELCLVVPPLAEQLEIALYLDDATIKIDALIAKAREMTAVLRERRQALISAAVTGKIDVREL